MPSARGWGPGGKGPRGAGEAGHERLAERGDAPRATGRGSQARHQEGAGRAEPAVGASVVLRALWLELRSCGVKPTGPWFLVAVAAQPRDSGAEEIGVRERSQKASGLQSGKV